MVSPKTKLVPRWLWNVGRNLCAEMNGSTRLPIMLICVSSSSSSSSLGRLSSSRPVFTPTSELVCDTVVANAYINRVPKKLVHQAHVDNLVNSQRIFIIPSLAHSLENLRCDKTVIKDFTTPKTCRCTTL